MSLIFPDVLPLCQQAITGHPVYHYCVNVLFVSTKQFGAVYHSSKRRPQSTIFSRATQRFLLGIKTSISNERKYVLHPVKIM